MSIARELALGLISLRGNSARLSIPILLEEVMLVNTISKTLCLACCIFSSVSAQASPEELHISTFVCTDLESSPAFSPIYVHKEEPTSPYSQKIYGSIGWQTANGQWQDFPAKGFNYSGVLGFMLRFKYGEIIITDTEIGLRGDLRLSGVRRALSCVEEVN
jgi:hypothetical protein